jgi:hypothetical protein
VDVLDVGCGRAKTPGALGIDARASSAADVVHDLDVRPWPPPASAFDRIVCRHVLEHVADPIGFMEEIHRVGRAGASVELVTPHFSSRFSYTDPTHRRHLSLSSFDFFVEAPPFRPSLLSRALETQSPARDFYPAVRFEMRSRHLRFALPYRVLGLQWLANRFPHFYEGYCAFVVPARDLYVTLGVRK